MSTSQAALSQVTSVRLSSLSGRKTFASIEAANAWLTDRKFPGTLACLITLEDTRSFSCSVKPGKTIDAAHASRELRCVEDGAVFAHLRNRN